MLGEAHMLLFYIRDKNLIFIYRFVSRYSDDNKKKHFFSFLRKFCFIVFFKLIIQMVAFQYVYCSINKKIKLN